MSLIALDEVKGGRATSARSRPAPVVAAPRILTQSAPAPAPVSFKPNVVTTTAPHPLLKEYGVASDPDWIWRANNYSAEDLRGLLDKMVPKPAPEVKPVSWLSSGLERLGISKGVQRAVTGAVVPAPLNAAANAIAPLFGGGRGGGAPTQQYLPAVGAAAGAVGRLGGLFGRMAGSPAGRAVGRAVGTGVAGAAGWEIGQRIFGSNGNGNGLMPSGYHYNKALRRYEIARANGRDVQDPRDEPRVKNEIVRNRSMNVLNPRALSRANTRICGFSRVARRTLKDLGYTVSATRRGTGRGCKTKKRCR